jgi:hypothetical protein
MVRAVGKCHKRRRRFATALRHADSPMMMVTRSCPDHPRRQGSTLSSIRWNIFQAAQSIGWSGTNDKPIKRKRQEPCEGRPVQGKEEKFSFCTLQVKADAETPMPMPFDDLCSVSKR